MLIPLSGAFLIMFLYIWLLLPNVCIWVFLLPVNLLFLILMLFPFTRRLMFPVSFEDIILNYCLVSVEMQGMVFVVFEDVA